MRLRTPRWWYQRRGGPRGALWLLLAPVAAIWGLVTARRIARARPADPGVAVVCVGNLTLGGTGKTPVVRALADLATARGRRVAILSRGHGGREPGPLRVDLARHDAAAVGDEGLMLAVGHAVWIARDRAAGAREAAASGANLVLMDDGHQNPFVKKALSLLVVDGETRDGEWPFGGGGVFPLGPMREPLAAGLARADAVILLLPADLAAPAEDLLDLLGDTPVLTARLEGAAPPPKGPQLAFAGIGKPWKMERALKAAGCDLVDFASLPDHGVIPEATLAFLADRARALGAGLVTSEKDYARLTPAWRQRVSAWPVRARFEDEAAAWRLVEAAINGD